MTHPTHDSSPASRASQERGFRWYLQRVRRVWATIGTIVLVVLAGWSAIAYRADGSARAAIAGDDLVQVTRGDGHWKFAPRGVATSPARGLLFFAGALVDPIAYAPMARDVATAGYPVLLVELPNRGAFGAADGPEVIDRARAAMASVPEASGWVVAGHSKGAVVAARMLHEDASGIVALVLVGTTHPRDFSLAASDVPMTKIVGDKDCIADLAKSERRRPLLPATTRWIVIEGGNHSQFGNYGFQPGDCRAGVDPERQRALTTEAIVLALAADER